MSKIPEERDIRKQDLWKRIDDARDANAAESKDLSNRIDGIEQKISSKIDAAIEKGLKEVDAARQKLVSLLSEQIKLLEVRAKDGLDDIKTLADGHMKLVDKRNGEFRATVSGEIATQVKAQYSAILAAVKEVEGEMEAYKRDLSAGIAKTLTDNTDRLAALSKKVQDIEDRLKKVFGAF